jgi:hypothetical protein
MPPLLTHPAIFGLAATALLLAASFYGSLLRARKPQVVMQNEKPLKALEGAILGLLALLVGFTFSMAIARYDLHIQAEIDEANAIGTVWQRADTLPTAQRAEVQQLLRQYVQVRLDFPKADTDAEQQHVLAETMRLQTQLWAIAQTAASAQRDPISALFLTSLNDASDAAEKRTAALGNRIPALAWAMLVFMSCMGSLFVGMSIASRSPLLLMTLPFVLGVVLTLVRDLDSPHAGFIQVDQQSMQRLAEEVR